MTIGKPIYFKIILWSVLILLVLADGFNFLVSSFSHISLLPSWAETLRFLLLIGVILGLLSLVLLTNGVRKPEIVQSGWKSILWMVSIIILAAGYSINFPDSGFHKTSGVLNSSPEIVAQPDDFEEESGTDNDTSLFPAPVNGSSFSDTTIRPNNVFSILFAYSLGTIFILFASLIWLHLRNYIFYKHSGRYEFNFYLLLSVVLTLSLTASFDTDSVFRHELVQIPLYILFSIYTLMNSFRLSWVLYVSRKEKILSIFLLMVLIALNIIFMATDLVWSLNALEFLSVFVVTLIRLTLTFFLTYLVFSFFSIVFHLPTSDAFEKKAAELTSLHSLSRLISSVFDIRELSEAVVNFSIQTTQADAAWLETYAEPTGNQPDTKLLSPKNINSGDIQTLMSNNGVSLRQELKKSRMMVNVPVASTHPLVDQDFVKKRKIGSIIGVPLIARDNLVGGLFVTKSPENGFDREDVDTVLTFAEQAAIAIDNTRLFEMSLEKERLQQELFIAQNIQMKLLPQSNPKLDCMDIESVSYPAYEVGGDYYDFLLLPDNRLGIVVADVSGKGTSAAFYMAEVKGIFQSLARNFPDPKALLSEANHVLFHSLEKKSFVSVLYVVVDQQTGIVETARAGHCPLLLVRANGEATYIRSKGIGLGMGSTEVVAGAIEPVNLKLEQDDLLILFSDGVVEAMNEAQEEYGYERLRQVCVESRFGTSRDVLDKIISDVNTFIWNGRANDDLTLVVTKWKNRK